MQNKDWPHLAGLLGSAPAEIALLGAPMAKGSVSACAYHKAPARIRAILGKISTYDLESAVDIKDLNVFDAGDIPIEDLSPEDGFAPLRAAFAPLCASHALSICLGGHNGITRAGVHAVDSDLKTVGLLTLDAHFDLRPTDTGLMNGNPVSALLEDGLSGEHIVQIGLAPFANSKAMHTQALKAGISVYTMEDCRRHGIEALVATALDYLSKRCKHIYIDFDIDVIERGLSPGAPGGRSAGLMPFEFFKAARLVGACEQVRAVDLCEYDPDMDINDTTALIAGRWLAELLCGFRVRKDRQL